MKFSKEPFTIDRDYAEKLETKREVFRKQTKTKKTLFTTLITTFGLKKSKTAYNFVYLQLDDLF